MRQNSTALNTSTNNKYDSKALFKTISKTASGRDLLEKTQAKFSTGNLRIEAYPVQLLSEVKKSLVMDIPVGACLLAGADQNPVIYIDVELPLELNAVFVVHELTLVADSNYWQQFILKADRSISDSLRKKCIMEQRKWLEEMKAKDKLFDDRLRVFTQFAA